MQENGSDFTLSKPTEGVKLSGAAAGGATVNGSTLWRHPLGGGRRCNVRIGSSLCHDIFIVTALLLLPIRTNLSGNRTEKILDRHS